MESNYSLEEFIESIPTQSTKTNYRANINRFCEWYGKSVEEILKERQDDWTRRPDENHVDYLNRKSRFEKLLVKFHDEQEAKGISKNSARTYTVGVIQLFKYYEMPLLLKNNQKRISQTMETTRNFRMNIDHVREMFKHADQRERVILSLATDLGLRIGDFTKLRIDEVPDLDQEPPIPFEVMTEKEKILSHGFVSGETVELLKPYLTTLNKSKNPYLFPDKNGSHISREWLNELIQRLAVKAGIKLNGKAITFHCFRKMFISAGIDSGVGLAVTKILCGKQEKQSDSTYFTVVKYKPLFLRLKREITIQTHLIESSDDRQKLKDALRQSEEERAILRRRFEEIDENYSDIKFLFSTFGIDFAQFRPTRKAMERLPNLTPEEREKVINEAVNKIPELTSMEDMQQKIRNSLEAFSKRKENHDSL
jgi:integrase